jgi:hypothetical protein
MNQRKKNILSVFQGKNNDKDQDLNRDLDSYSVKLIKTVGIIGIIIGFAIVIAFWYWVFKMLYKIN